MSRIIIENRSSASDVEVVACVAQIIREGRISNNGKQYAYGTRCGGDGLQTIMVWTDLNKKSDRFVAVDDKS